MRSFVIVFENALGDETRRKVRARSYAEAEGPCWRVLLNDYPGARLLRVEPG
jgi:hypothetical protein